LRVQRKSLLLIILSSWILAGISSRTFAGDPEEPEFSRIEPVGERSEDGTEEEVRQALQSATQLAEELVQSAENLEDKPIEKSPEISVEEVRSRFSNAIFLMHKKIFRRELVRIMNRLSYPGDPTTYKLRFNATPLPLRAMEKLEVVAPHSMSQPDPVIPKPGAASTEPPKPELPQIEIYLGLLAFVTTEDELAAALAHRMAHANPILYASPSQQKANQQIENVIQQIEGHRSLDGKHREEIRADLASVERLIRAGYNPWAAYTIHRRIAKFVTDTTKAVTVPTIFQMLFGNRYLNLQNQPLEELRMEAMKIYIMNKGFQEDLADIVERETKFPNALKPLIWQSKVMGAPFRMSRYMKYVNIALPVIGLVALWRYDRNSRFFAEKFIHAVQVGMPLFGAALLLGMGSYATYKIFQSRVAISNSFQSTGAAFGRGMYRGVAGIIKVIRATLSGSGKLIYRGVPALIKKIPSVLMRLGVGAVQLIKFWGSLFLELKNFFKHAVGPFVTRVAKSTVNAITTMMHFSGKSVIHGAFTLWKQLTASFEMWRSQQESVESRLGKARNALVDSLENLRGENLQDMHWMIRFYALSTEHIFARPTARPSLWLALKNIEKIMTSLGVRERQMILGALGDDLNRFSELITRDAGLRKRIVELWKLAGGKSEDDAFFSEEFALGSVGGLTKAFDEEFRTRTFNPYATNGGQSPHYRYRVLVRMNIFAEASMENFRRQQPFYVALDAIENFEDMPVWKKYRALQRMTFVPGFFNLTLRARRSYISALPEFMEELYSRKAPDEEMSRSWPSAELLRRIEQLKEAFDSTPTKHHLRRYDMHRELVRAEALEEFMRNNTTRSQFTFKKVINLGFRFFPLWEESRTRYTTAPPGETWNFHDHSFWKGSTAKFDRAFVRAAKKVTEPYAKIGLLEASRKIPSDISNFSSILRFNFKFRDRKYEWMKFGREGWNDKMTPWVRTFIESRVHSVSGLRKFIVEELNPRGIDPEGLILDFYHLIFAHPEWLKTKEDMDHLTESAYFWPKRGSLGIQQSAIESTLLKYIDEQAKKFPKYWGVEPSAAEALHKRIVQFQNENHFYGDSFEEQFKFWKALSARGVTSVTDAMFEKLYAAATTEQQKHKLEEEAVRGRIWDLPLKVAIVRSRVHALESYRYLVNSRERLGYRDSSDLTRVLNLVEKELPEKGLGYIQLLEEISNDIYSSRDESHDINQAKYGTSAPSDRAQDLGARLISDILKEVLSWRKDSQWEFIKFLRGDGEPSTFIRKQFAVTGYERIRRVFQLLPISARAAIFDSFLSAPGGLLEKCDPKSKHAQRIIDYLLAGGDEDARRVGRQILEAFLYSLQGGNENVRSYVLSYLLSMVKANEEASIGRTLRNVLEVFGATGVKIGQILAATEILPEKENQYLFDLQEKAKVPEREFIYTELEQITKHSRVPYKILQLLGAASLKFAVKAIDLNSGKPLVLKVLRQASLMHTRAEFKQLTRMTEYLVRNYGSKYGLLRAIIGAAQQAVARELSLTHEAKMSELVASTVYAKPSVPGVKVRVPVEIIVAPRLMASEFAEGTSFRQLPESTKPFAAKAILAIETPNLFDAKPATNESKVIFDPDRHAGNFRLHLTGENSLRLSPIDFGQVVNISYAEREQVYDLFALAQILKKTGATKWAAGRAAKIIGKSETDALAIYANMRTYFRVSSEMKEVTAYYNLLAVLNDAKVGRPIAFFDFARSIMQLGQYRKHLEASELAAYDPQLKLREIVQVRADKMVAEMANEIRTTDGAVGRVIERKVRESMAKNSAAAQEVCKEALRRTGTDG
jgi:predicted unusual protein kinase regulating ubiquinone biosynthesis (AarF/ABC1/UbiB family)